MKAIEVPYQQDNSKFFGNFGIAFLDDIQKALKENYSDQVLFTIVCECIDQMTLTKAICLNKKAEIKITRIEGLILDSGAVKFTFVPLDDDRLPVLLEQDCSVMIIGPSPEDIERESKSKKVRFFGIKNQNPPMN